MKHYFSMASTNVKYFEACFVQTLHQAPPEQKRLSSRDEQKRVSLAEMSRRGGRCTSVSSIKIGAAALAVSGTATATGKRSQGQRHQGQRPAASGTIEDGDQARWSRQC
jgi:hypothetical protein